VTGAALRSSLPVSGFRFPVSGFRFFTLITQAFADFLFPPYERHRIFRKVL
jgi:hypothetical protein